MQAHNKMDNVIKVANVCKMQTSVEGVYRQGRVELTQLPDNVTDETRVIVTFVQPNQIDLSSGGIDLASSEVLRAKSIYLCRWLE